MTTTRLNEQAFRSFFSSITRPTLRRMFVSAGLALSMGVSLPVPNSAFAQIGSPNISGSWLLTCTSKRGRERQVTLQIQQDGSRLGGTYNANGASGPLSGSVQGTQVSLNGGAFAFAGSATNNTISGQNQRGRPCSATRE